MADLDVAALWDRDHARRVNLADQIFDTLVTMNKVASGAYTTHCMEMWSDHFSGDHTADVHYTADGITGLVKSTVDGRFYRILITPYEDEGGI